jgi:hypothetical protein
MKKVFGLLAAFVLAACSSSSNNGNSLPPPTPTSYSYGTGTPVAQNSMQATAATDANSSTSQVVSAATSGSVSNNATTLSSAPQLPSTLATDLGTAEVAPKLPQSYDVVGALTKARKAGTLDTGCYTVSGDTISYNNCSYDYGSGFTYTTSGTLTSTPTSLTWSITAKITYSSTTSGGGSYVINGTWNGNLTFASTSTDTVINGTATEGFSGNFTDSQENVDFAYTAQIAFKSLDISQSCDSTGGVVSGKLDISVTAIASGVSASQLGYENYGYEFTWNGCDTILVAVGSAG